jgi:zinc transport system permease protein
VVSRIDLAVIWGGAAVSPVCWSGWRALLAECVKRPCLCRQLNPWRDRIMLTLLIAAVVAVSIKVIGALLITAMLIIPLQARA